MRGRLRGRHGPHELAVRHDRRCRPRAGLVQRRQRLPGVRNRPVAPPVGGEGQPHGLGHPLREPREQLREGELAITPPHNLLWLTYPSSCSCTVQRPCMRIGAARGERAEACAWCGGARGAPSVARPHVASGRAGSVFAPFAQKNAKIKQVSVSEVSWALRCCCDEPHGSLLLNRASSAPLRAAARMLCPG